MACQSGEYLYLLIIVDERGIEWNRTLALDLDTAKQFANAYAANEVIWNDSPSVGYDITGYAQLGGQHPDYGREQYFRIEKHVIGELP